MLTFENYLSTCRSLLLTGDRVECAVEDSIGYRLAADVIAVAESPRFASSAMDGFAVKVVDVPGVLRIAGESAAGTLPTAEVSQGSAVRIMTGAALPKGTEAVIPVEQTVPEGDAIRVLTATEPGQFLRAAGSDVRVGQLLIGQGQRIGPAQLSALCANEIATVLVHPRRRVAVISTGEELVDAGQVARGAQLVDANGPGLAAAITAAGAEVVCRERCGDDPASLVALLDALPEVDLIVTSGGVSMGDYDVVKAALRPLGIHFEQVAVRPGRPQAWGHFRGHTPLLGLPGNPVSALVSFELFGRAALGSERTRGTAMLAVDFAGADANRRLFAGGLLVDGAVTIGSHQESHLIGGLARANCLVDIPAGAPTLNAGTTVGIISLGD